MYLRLNSLLGRLLDYRRDDVESDVSCNKRKKGGGGGTTSDDTETSLMLTAAGTLVTFGDFEFVVLLVPQAAPVAGGNLDRKLRVWAVRRRQGEIRGWEIKTKRIRVLWATSS